MNMPTDWTLNLVERPTGQPGAGQSRRVRRATRKPAWLTRRAGWWMASLTLAIGAVAATVTFTQREAPSISTPPGVNESPTRLAEPNAAPTPSGDRAKPEPSPTPAAPDQPIDRSVAVTGDAQINPAVILRDHQLGLNSLAYEGQRQAPDAHILMTFDVQHAKAWDAFTAAMGTALKTTHVEANKGQPTLTIAGRTPAHLWTVSPPGVTTTQPTERDTIGQPAPSLNAVLLQHAAILDTASGDATTEGLNVTGMGSSAAVTDVIYAFHAHPAYRWLEWTLAPSTQPDQLTFTGRIASRTEGTPTHIDVGDLPWVPPSEPNTVARTHDGVQPPVRVHAWATGPHESVLLMDTRTQQSVLAVHPSRAQRDDAVLLALHANQATVTLDGETYELDLLR